MKDTGSLRSAQELFCDFFLMTLPYIIVQINWMNKVQDRVRRSKNIFRYDAKGAHKNKHTNKQINKKPTPEKTKTKTKTEQKTKQKQNHICCRDKKQ